MGIQQSVIVNYPQLLVYQMKSTYEVNLLLGYKFEMWL
jgi:hypothetical protein